MSADNAITTKKKFISTTVRNILFFILVVVLVIAGFIYWLYSQRYVSTDDAYINANVVQIASRVTGQVLHLYADNNDFVKQGELLFQIDPQPFIAAVDQAQAQVAINQAQLQNALVTYQRIETLVDQKMMAPQAGDNAEETLQSAKASLQLATAQLDAADLNLQYTEIYAPTDGWITNSSLREGSAVTMNEPLFALVSNQTFWVDANYKETDLYRIHPGQTATIKVDMYPDKVFQGVVLSVSRGSGAVFSLLPPQNATGNWVKVTQRVPVKVQVLNPDPQYPLRIGTTATVTIDTHSKGNG